LPVLTQMGFITTGRSALPGGDRVPTLLNSPIPYTANVLGYGNSLIQHLATNIQASQNGHAVQRALQRPGSELRADDNV